MARHGNTTEYESYRAVIDARTRTPDGDDTEVIVTRQDVPGSSARVWLTLRGAWRGTVCLDGDAVHELREMLNTADDGPVRTYDGPLSPPYVMRCGSCGCAIKDSELDLLPQQCPLCEQPLD